MGASDQYYKDLEEAEQAMLRIRDRLFEARDPGLLEEAMARYYMTYGKWPSYKQYWDTIIMGLKQNIKKVGK